MPLPEPTSDLIAPDIQRVNKIDDLPPIKTRRNQLDASYETLGQALTAAGQPSGDEIDSIPFPESAPAAPPVVGHAQTAYAPAVPSSAPAVPPPAPGQAPPVTDRDTPRVRDRIGQLWGQKRDAEERALQLEQRLAQLESARYTPPSYPQNSNPYGSAPQYAPPHETPFDPTFGQQAPPPPAGQFVSRQELAAMFAQQKQEAQRERDLGTAQVASRLEAERDFSDVFENPELRAAAADIWDRDRTLRDDPRGPWKAAAIVRGLSVANPVPPGSPVADARKQAIAGVGASVPSGSGATSDRATRYHAALRRARQTQRTEDFAFARRIQLGLE